MEIILPILIVGGIALIGGLVLSVVSVYVNVAEDHTVKEIEAALPGANCGGCGYSGCAGYAKAVADQVAPIHLCAPGGRETAEELGRITGQSPLEVSRRTAVVACKGTFDSVRRRMDYRGIKSCAAAVTYYGGTNTCSFGCVGIGDCISSCVYKAIYLKDGIAHIDQSRCAGCSTCVGACPKGIIRMVRTDSEVMLLCSSRDRGAATAKTCKSGCIACGICVKNCPQGAIEIENNLAVINAKICTGCGICAQKCPKKVIGIRSDAKVCFD